MTDNYFNLPDPDKWFCSVDEYRIGHSEMYITVYNSEAKLQCGIVLNGVEYFSGFMRWQGADFTLGDPDEMLALLKTTTLYERTSTESLLEHKFLLAKVVNTSEPDTYIKIIVDSAHVGLPQHFNWI